MMFNQILDNILSRKRKLATNRIPDLSGSIPTGLVKNAFYEVRSMYGNGFHIMSAENRARPFADKAPALCGFTSWVSAASQEAVVSDEVFAASEKRFHSWHYCAECVAKLRKESAPTEQ